MSIRVRITAFVDRHEVAWELTMAGLAIVFVALAFVEQTQTVLYLDIALTLIFLAEFSLRFWAAASRRAYLRGHWIDLIALLPAIREFRILRLARLARGVRAFSGIYRALGHYGPLARNRGLLGLFAVWAAVMVLSSLGLYAAEHGVNAAVDNPFDALWWGVSTLTTVGYGDVTPVTVEGRIAAMVLMLLGIGIFAAITATATGALMGGGRREDPVARLDRLDGLFAAGRVSQDEYDTKRVDILDGL
jgi:voltage-gated potassium channel Kch